MGLTATQLRTHLWDRVGEVKPSALHAGCVCSRCVANPGFPLVQIGIVQRDSEYLPWICCECIFRLMHSQWWMNTGLLHYSIMLCKSKKEEELTTSLTPFPGGVMLPDISLRSAAWSWYPDRHIWWGNFTYLYTCRVFLKLCMTSLKWSIGFLSYILIF